jgi:hypothetical protein
MWQRINQIVHSFRNKSDSDSVNESLDWIAGVLAVAPYSKYLYQALLVYMQQSGNITFCKAVELHRNNGINKSSVNVVLRHDLDSDPLNVQTLTNIEEGLGISSSIYVRVDDETYHIESCRDMLIELHDKGFEIGIHTIAYREENWKVALLADIDKFSELLGFTPCSVNTHGYSSDELIWKRRSTFLNSMCEDKDISSQIVLTDHNCTDVYNYGYGDANFARNRSVVYLKNDILRAPQLQPGSNAYFMTHSDYWK